MPSYSGTSIVLKELTEITEANKKRLENLLGVKKHKFFRKKIDQTTKQWTHEDLSKHVEVIFQKIGNKNFSLSGFVGENETNHHVDGKAYVYLGAELDGASSKHYFWNSTKPEWVGIQIVSSSGGKISIDTNDEFKRVLEFYEYETLAVGTTTKQYKTISIYDYTKSVKTREFNLSSQLTGGWKVDKLISWKPYGWDNSVYQAERLDDKNWRLTYHHSLGQQDVYSRLELATSPDRIIYENTQATNYISIGEVHIQLVKEVNS